MRTQTKGKLTVELVRLLIDYNPLTGELTYKKRQRKHDDFTKRIHLRCPDTDTRFRITADRIACILGFGVIPRLDQRVLHLNLKHDDLRLCNLKIVSRKTLIIIKEANRNLSGGIRIVPHKTDQFTYIVHWYENNVEKRKQIDDLIIARRLEKRLRLKYSKILTKYCVFD